MNLTMIQTECIISLSERERIFNTDGLDDEIKKNKTGGACGACGARRGAYRGLVGKPEGKRPLGRPRRQWEDIEIDLKI